MTAEILIKFARKGIILSPEAYELIANSENPLNLSSEIIVKLKSGNYSKEMVPVDVNTLKSMEGLNFKLNIPKDQEIKTPTQEKPIAPAMEKPQTKVEEEVNAPGLDGSPVAQAEQNSTHTLQTEQKPAMEQNGSATVQVEKPVMEDRPVAAVPEEKETATIQTPEKPIIEEKETATIQTPEKPIIEEKETATVQTEEKPIAEEKSLDPIEEEPEEAKAELSLEEKYKKLGYDREHVEKITDTEVSEDTKIKYKRNLTESTVSFDRYKVIQDTSNKSYTSGDIGNLIEYFQNRYKKLSNILSKRPELRTWQKINEITENQTDLNLIVMITDIRSTKNGHYLIEVEDDTGSIPVLVSKDNEEMINAAKNLMKDEVIGIVAQKRPGAENQLAICQNLIDPGVPRMPRKDTEFGTVFTSDIHIGSQTFLEDAFVRFTRWLNGDFGDERQREMANNVKYMIVGGDIVDGIGVYPNQDKELAIKDITAQYDEAARLLGDIRSDIKIIITPGNHDASRVAEPQPAVPEKYAKSLYQLNNVEFLSNPSMVSLDGLEVLIYHGRGIDDMVMGSNDFSHERNDLVMKEFLRKRHLAPLYGERTPLASELEDHLVIDKVPDVLHTGHVHINTYTNYNGIHCINSGTFQTQTEFQKIYNIMPTPAEVPILDVGGVYRQLDFK
ncbi:DNA-directed DNA polymerase II small subunit [uncultured Methanobrevibacter sp.]|uniref:DNA-directed DNA polymerase II small subunit n=1 Tax=uncultured Methanobrevibacter sp. TaxID=253161 RepID=UPI0025D40C4D|nr:DNA-directed DNA polymerase II small subunit [uncultured Methanobrevibacter sp.]